MKDEKELYKERLLKNIRSSPEDLRRFLSSTIYKDFISEIDLRLIQTSLMLEDFECQFSGRQYDMFRGRKRNLLEMKQLFSDMLQNKISDLKETKEENSDVN